MAEEKNDVQVPEKFQKLVDEISKMSVLDLSELVKVLEEVFGVSAAPMAMAMPAAGAAGAAGEPAAEKTSFDVVIKDKGATAIQVIKAVKEILPDLGLKEAKELVDSAPKAVKQGVKKEEAEEMKKKLEEAGAVVELV